MCSRQCYIYIHFECAIYRLAWAIVCYNGWAVQSLKSVIAIVPTLSFLLTAFIRELWKTYIEHMKRTYLLMTVLLLLFSSSVDARKKEYKNGDYYVGEWKKGLPNGLGKMVFANGDVYEGVWNFGVFEKGKMTYKHPELTIGVKPKKAVHKVDRITNSSKNDFYNLNYYRDTDFIEYNGLWNNNKPNGEGCAIHRDKSIYTGTWENGILIEGKKILKNGAEYNGTFRTDKTFHIGEHKFTNGMIARGEFVNNIIRKGKILKPNGEWYEGDFCENAKFYNGEGEYQIDNTYYKGTWLNGTFSTGKVKGNISGTYFDGEMRNSDFYTGTIKGNIGDNYFDGTFVDGKFYEGTCVAEIDGKKYSGEFTKGVFVKGECRSKDRITTIENYDYFGNAVYDMGNYTGYFDSALNKHGKGSLSFIQDSITIEDALWRNDTIVSGKGSFVRGNKKYQLTIEDITDSDSCRIVISLNTNVIDSEKIDRKKVDSIEFVEFISELSIRKIKEASRIYAEKHLVGNLYATKVKASVLLTEFVTSIMNITEGAYYIIAVGFDDSEKATFIKAIGHDYSGTREDMILQSMAIESLTKDNIHIEEEFIIEDGILKLKEYEFTIKSKNEIEYSGITLKKMSINEFENLLY